MKVEVIKSRANKGFNRDPKGFFVIRIENEKIVVEHYKRAKMKLNLIIEGGEGESIYHTIVDKGLLSLCTHGFYLGMELAKAEHCLKNKKHYVQDGEPDG